MGMTPEDAAREEFYDQMSAEFYPEHRDQALLEFAQQRQRSYYVSNPEVIQPLIRRLEQAKGLHNAGHSAASCLFSVSSAEYALKIVLLKPTIYGLVHNDHLAEAVADVATAQTGHDRYRKILTGIFENIVGIRLFAIRREGAVEDLFSEILKAQRIRNGIIHLCKDASREDAEFALRVAEAVHVNMVLELMSALALNVDVQGRISEAT